MRFQLTILSILIFAFTCANLLQAQALSFNDKRMVKFFKKDYHRYGKYFDNFKESQRAELQGYFTKMERYLAKISPKAKANPKVVELQEQLDALRVKLGGEATKAEAAARKAPVRNLKPVKTVRQPTGKISTSTPSNQPTQSDAQIARTFQRDYNDAYNTIRRTRGKELIDEAKVGTINGKLAVLANHLAAIKDPNQGFVKQMQANYDNLKKHFDGAVERAEKQHGANLAKDAKREADKEAAKKAAEEAKKAQVTETKKVRPLGYAMKRYIGFFDKDFHRYSLYYNRADLKKSDLKDYIAKLEKRLSAVQPADHPEVLSRKAKVEEWKKRLVSFVEAPQTTQPATTTVVAQPTTDKPKPVKPLPYRDTRRVKTFDTDMQRNKFYLESKNPDNLLTIHQIVAKLKSHLSLVDYHSQNHPEVLKRKEALAKLEKSIQDNFGEVRLFTDEEKKLLGEFRNDYNRNQYSLNERLNPISLQDPALRKECEALLARMNKTLSAIENDKHPKFLAEKKRYDELKKRYDQAVGKSDKLEAAAGDVDSQLELIQQEFPYKKFDPKLPENATPAEIEDWARRLKGFLVTVDKALAFFEKAKKTSIKARSDDFLTYSYWFKQNVKGSIKSALKWAKRDFESPIYQGKRAVKEGTQLHNQTHVKFAKQHIKRGLWGAYRLAAFERGHDGKASAQTLADIEAIKAMRVKLLGGVEESIRRKRMPKAASESAELLAIAKDAIARGAKYWEIGPYERMVINYDRNRKREGRWYDTTFRIHDWDEFQVTIAEQDGDVYWTRTAMIKNYRDPSGKLTEWKVANSRRWNKILKENINKPPLED